MQGIEFDTEEKMPVRRSFQPGTPKEPDMAKLLVKVGITNPKTANLALVGIAIICFGLSIYLFMAATSKKGSIELTPEQKAAGAKIMSQMMTQKPIR